MFIEKVTEVEEVSYRSHGLKKQATKAKEGPLEPRRKRGKENMPGEGNGVTNGTRMLPGEDLTRSSVLRVFIWRFQGGIPIECSASQVCLLRVMVFTDWSVPGQGAISQCSWS